jgi:hypothetical protein
LQVANCVNGVETWDIYTQAKIALRVHCWGLTNVTKNEECGLPLTRLSHQIALVTDVFYQCKSFKKTTKDCTTISTPYQNRPPSNATN